jgi:hypothetical protein
MACEGKRQQAAALQSATRPFKKMQPEKAISSDRLAGGHEQCGCHEQALVNLTFWEFFWE